MPKMQFITEEMMNRADRILAAAERINEGQNAVLDIFRNIGRYFNGKVPTLMVENMLAMDGDYQAMNENLEGYSAFLNEAAMDYEWDEIELAKWASSLGRTE